MVHLFGKDHKERMSVKLVKKLQRQEDKSWYEEQIRRLEQEEKDAAFARELQEQMASAESSTYTDGAYTTSYHSPSPTISPAMVTHSPISSSPPPIPAKPTAYYSGSPSTSSATSNYTDHQGTARQAISYSDASSSSSTTHRDIPPPSYANGQPPLPPRQRTVSQLSRHEPEAYYTNTIAAIEIGHHSRPGHPIQHRDPAMLIIPPPQQTDMAPTAYNNPFYPSSIMAMPEPEPVRHISSEYSTTPPYDPSAHSTSIGQSAYIPTPPPSSSSSSHSIASTSFASFETPISSIPKMATTSYQSQQHPTAMKPDTIVEKPNEHTSNRTFSDMNGSHQPTTIVNKEHMEDSNTTTITAAAAAAATDPPPSPPGVATAASDDGNDDDDDIGSMFWECNDGRMMDGNPSTKSTANKSTANKSTANTALNTDDTTSITRQGTVNGKHLTVSNDVDDEGHDIGSGSESVNDNEAIAVDLFDITDNDNVIIHQHNGTKISTRSMKNHNSDDCDPFADSFAVGPSSFDDQHPSKVADHASSFQMNKHVPTTAKVYDPLLGATTKPASAVPWDSSSFASSSVSLTLAATSPPLQPSPRPASVHRYPIHHGRDNSNDLICLDDADTPQVIPTNVLHAGAPPNIQFMMNQVTADVPSSEFGYYQYQVTKPGGEKEEVDDTLMENAPKLPKTHPDHRHITVPSVVENQHVWIRIHPTDTGKSLASRIHIVATYKTRKIVSIKTDKGRSIPLDDTPLFEDWADVMQLEDGASWSVEWTAMDNPWEGPKEFLRYLKDSMHLSHD